MTKLIATHTGKLNLGHLEAPCAVLESGLRVVSWRGLIDTIGRSRRLSPRNHCVTKLNDNGRDFNRLHQENLASGGNHCVTKLGNQVKDQGDTYASDGHELAIKLLPANLRPAIEVHTEVLRALPGEFLYKFSRNGAFALGIQARLLVEVCEVYVIGMFRGLLRSNQMAVAERCRKISAATSAVGMDALVDDACDYQPQRGDYTEEYLKHFLNRDPSNWKGRFPPEYYREIYRLHDWSYQPSRNRHPQQLGHITNDIVYSRLPPGILQELQRRNPTDDAGRRAYKHHQFLTDETGVGALYNQINTCVTLLTPAHTWKGFMRSLDLVTPRQSQGLVTRDDQSVPNLAQLHLF